MLVLAVSLGSLGANSSVGWGQGGGPIVDPRPFGIDLAPGARSVPKGQCVATMDDCGRLVVGRLYVQVGDAAVVMLPDGQLVPRKRDDFTVADRKFEPIPRDVLADQLKGEYKGFKVVHSKHYVYVYKSSEEFLLGTSRILESMLDGVIKQARAYGLTVRSPELPLIVVMFANKADFQSYRRLPDDVTAYYHPVSNRVFLHEPVELGEKDRALAVSQAVSTVAHEGAHQILHNIGVQQRLSAWPMWLSEGLAEYYSPTSFGKNLTWRGPSGGNNLRLFELQRYLRPDAPPPDGGMIEQTVIAARLTSAGYASAWALTHFLAKSKDERDAFKELVQEASRLGPLEGAIADKGDVAILANLDQFQKYFGKDMPGLETRLITDLRKLHYEDPFAALPHHLVKIVVTVNQRAYYAGGVFYSSVLAEKWAKELIDSLPPEQQEKAYQSVPEFDNRAVAEANLKVWLKKGPPLPRPTE